MESVKAVCSSCGGTGLYEGMCEEKGYPVVCLSCDGTGCEEIRYKPFKEIRKIKGVKGVRLSRGRSIVLGCGGTEKVYSYQEFLAGKVRYR